MHDASVASHSSAAVVVCAADKEGSLVLTKLHAAGCVQIIAINRVIIQQFTIRHSRLTIHHFVIHVNFSL